MWVGTPRGRIAFEGTGDRRGGDAGEHHGKEVIGPASPQVALLQLPVAAGAVGVDPAPADHEISGHIFMCQREHLRIVARSDMQDREE